MIDHQGSPDQGEAALPSAERRPVIQEEEFRKAMARRMERDMEARVTLEGVMPRKVKAGDSGTEKERFMSVAAVVSWVSCTAAGLSLRPRMTHPIFVKSPQE
jgi:hypothetical protein